MNWRDKALCVDSGVDFFSEDPLEVDLAKSICHNCPVRRDCLQYALDEQIRFGVWAGKDEKELRQILSLDQFGKPVRRKKKPHCPNCSSKNVVELEKNRTKLRMSCTDCNMTWWTRRVSKVVEIDATEDLEGDVFSDPTQQTWD